MAIASVPGSERLESALCALHADAVPGANSHSAPTVRRDSVRLFAHNDTW